MPYAVTHFLIPAILIALFRDFCLRKKDKLKFPLHYVLIAGLAGLLPDLDTGIYYILSFFGFSFGAVHRTFSHNLFFPLIFLILGFIFLGVRNKELGKHKLKLSTTFFVTAFGAFMHIVLDGIFSGVIMPLYPFSLYALGINLVNSFPVAWRNTIEPSLDAGLLILWMIWLEVRHKISDYI